MHSCKHLSHIVVRGLQKDQLPELISITLLQIVKKPDNGLLAALLGIAIGVSPNPNDVLPRIHKVWPA